MAKIRVSLTFGAQNRLRYTNEVRALVKFPGSVTDFAVNAEFDSGTPIQYVHDHMQHLVRAEVMNLLEFT